MNQPTGSDQYQEWVGREEQREQAIALDTAVAMAATLDLDKAPTMGEPLPPGWQWLFFNPAVRHSELGTDGHPARGGFLPPVALPRRMWAGSRITYRAELPVGAEAVRKSRILKVSNKSGKSGALCFVTVAHWTSVGDTVCIEEEQDIVYREASPAGAAKPPAPARYEEEAQWTKLIEPDTPLLFRYSALTFNGHRIHYDRPYAQNEEGYRDLVVHGPLAATLLQQFAVEKGDGRRLSHFTFRGVQPLFVDRPFQLEARPEADGGLALWARGPDGELAMAATAQFQ